MAQHFPDYHSPLLALGKKVLLWGVMPALLVLATLYSFEMYMSPGQTGVDRAAHELVKKIDKANESQRKQTEELKKRIAAQPEAIDLKAELSKLTPAERQKRVNELMNEHAEKMHDN